MDSLKNNIIEWKFITTQLSEVEIGQWNKLCHETESCVAASFHSFAANSNQLSQIEQAVFAFGYQRNRLCVVVPCQLKAKKTYGLTIQQMQIISHDHLDFFAAAGQFSLDKNYLVESLIQALRAEKAFKWHLFTGRRWYLPNLKPNQFCSSTYQRQAAYFDLKANQALEQVVSKKLLKNLRRHEKKLAEKGLSVELKEILAPEQVNSTINDFVLLEKSGWKGQAGSAIGCSQQLVKFYQQTWQDLSNLGYARVFLLKSDQQILAAAIGFEFKQKLYLHKITYDETLAKYSPGSILVKQILEQILTKQSIKELCFNTNPDWVKRWHPQYHQLSAIVGFNANMKGVLLRLLFTSIDKLRFFKHRFIASQNKVKKDN